MDFLRGGYHQCGVISMLPDKLDVVKILPEKIVCGGRAVELSREKLGKDIVSHGK